MQILSYPQALALSVLPTPSAAIQGALVRLTTDNKPYWCDGAQWIDLTATGGGGGGSLAVYDEVSMITSSATSLVFKGEAVRATNDSGNITVEVTERGVLNESLVTTSGISGSCLAAAYGDGRYVVANSNKVLYSEDGRVWSLSNTFSPLTGQITSLAYGNGVFVATVNSNTGVWYSTDRGVTWAAATPSEQHAWASVAFGNGLFLAVSDTGTSRVMVSSDGVNWTMRSYTNPRSMVTFGNGKFVLRSAAASQTATTTATGEFFTESGATYVTPPAAIAYGVGVFVGVSNGTVHVSPNGLTWSEYSALPAVQWRGVTYGNGFFLAVSSDASGTCAFSKDGLNWTTRSGLASAYGVCFGEGMFVCSATAEPKIGVFGAPNYARNPRELFPFDSKQDKLVSGTNIKTLFGQSILGAGDLNPSVSAAPAGALSSVQYNNDGITGGASNVLIDGNDLVLAANASPSVPATDHVKLFGKLFGGTGGRTMPAAMGPSGMDYTTQPAFFRQNIALWKPPGNATTVPGVFGMAAPTAGGTATARNVATTNALTRARRLGYVSSTTAANYGGHYSTAAQFSLGNGSGLGGFMYTCRFGVSDASMQAAARTFVGLTSSVAAPTNVDPATLTNAVGIGHTASDTNWFIYYGGSAAQTRVNLGAGFPINNTDLIDITLWSPPTQNGVVFYHVTRIAATGVTTEASGQLGPGTAGTTLPTVSTLLAHRAWRNNNSAAAAVGIDINSVYIETDW